MHPDVDIYVGNYTIIDQEVFDLWIQGYSVVEAVQVLQHRGELDTWGATLELLTCDTSDHYRTFSMLEKLLLTPVKLAEEWTFQLEPAVQKLVIQKYYEFDDIVIREIIGKKLSGRTRKDLDDVAEKTGVLLRSCSQYTEEIFQEHTQVNRSNRTSIRTTQQNYAENLLKLKEELSSQFTD
ncbi:hypothetical protein SK128_016600 [Halocaridina rubra]|uniref:Uncharacterized protein n=1 Tax=Halocaridina rubra TaxID=373956 RepID=A0AAN8XFK9_HALRR